MAPKTESNGKIVKASEQKAVEVQATRTLADMLTDPRVKAAMAAAVPRHLSADKILRLALAALKTTPKLAQCTVDSFLSCVFQSAQLGLEPNTPMQQCYLIPRNTKYKDANGNDAWRLECTFLMGYQGMVELATRSGRVKSIRAHVVREGDEFDYELGLNERLYHKPPLDDDRDGRPIKYVYAIAEVDGSAPVWRVLSWAQVAARRDRSSSNGFSPWKSDEEAMTLKTGVRALFPWIPKSTDLMRAEALERADETGGDQRAAFAPDVIEAVERAGLQPIDVTPVEPPQEPNGSTTPTGEPATTAEGQSHG